MSDELDRPLTRRELRERERAQHDATAAADPDAEAALAEAEAAAEAALASERDAQIEPPTGAIPLIDADGRPRSRRELRELWAAQVEAESGGAERELSLEDTQAMSFDELLSVAVDEATLPGALDEAAAGSPVRPEEAGNAASEEFEDDIDDEIEPPHTPVSAGRERGISFPWSKKKAAKDEAPAEDAEQLAAEQAAAEQAEAELAATEAAELAAAEQAEAELAEAERVAAELAAAEAAELAELEALEAAELAEAERVAAEAAERAELEAAELAELEAAEAAELAELEAAEAAELAEAERAEAERVEAERGAAERAEAERLEAERLEAEAAELAELEAAEAAELAELEAAEAAELAEAERVAAEAAEVAEVAVEAAPAQEYSFPDIAPLEEERSVFDDPSTSTMQSIPDPLRGGISAVESSGDFDDLISRAVAAEGGSGSNTAALILPAMPDTGDMSGPLTETGEIFITGSIELPKSLSETGGHARLYDTVDTAEGSFGEDAGGTEAAPEDATAPVSATRAISAQASNNAIVTPATKKGNSLPLTLSIAGGGLLLAVIGLFVFGAMNGMFG